MTAQLHDLVFAVGSAILLVGLLPAVKHRSRLPSSTSLSVTIVLACFTANYATMGYWFAFAVEAGQTVCWAYLLSIGLAGGTW